MGLSLQGLNQGLCKTKFHYSKLTIAEFMYIMILIAEEIYLKAY